MGLKLLKEINWDMKKLILIFFNKKLKLKIIILF